MGNEESFEKESIEAFRLLDSLRHLTKQSSMTDDAVALVKLATTCIDNNDKPGAFAALKYLKLSIEQTRSLIDGFHDRETQVILEHMIWRRQTLELQRLLAEGRGEDGAAMAIQRELDQIEPFFSAAVADLDPDRP